MNYDQELLNLLLRKYETSRSFVDEGPAKRRIMLDFSHGRRGEFPAYDYEDYPQKILIHTAVNDLRQAGLVDYSWLRGDEGNILHRVWLCPDHLEAAYRQAGRLSPKDQASQIRSLLTDTEAIWRDADQEAFTWIGRLLQDLRRILEEKKRLASPWPLESELAISLLKLLETLMQLGPQIQTAGLYERVFSLKAFGDSKYFEKNLRSRLLNLIQRYYLPLLFADTDSNLNDLDFSDNDLLGLVGLVRAPEIFEFSGPLLARRPLTGDVDFGFFRNSATLSALELDGLELQIPDSLEKILFIENRTNYYALCQERTQPDNCWADALVIYHGGCFSPAKARFFELLRQAVIRRRSRQAANPIKIWHWGDIDLGGFMIFNRLREQFFHELQPYRMGRQDLLDHLVLAQPISEPYARKMRQTLHDQRYAIFNEVLSLALEKGVRLEQEAFLRE